MVDSLVFTKILKALTKHWSSQEIRTFTYLHDGADADSDFYEEKRVSNLVWKHVQRSVFVANGEKGQWVPVRSGKFRGYVLTLKIGNVQCLCDKVRILTFGKIR